MSDVKLFQTYEDGEIEVKDGVVTMDGGLQTALFVSMFGAEDWWGNLLESNDDRKVQSNTMKVLRENSLTSGTLIKVEDAVKRDIAWLEGEYTVEASIPQLNRVRINVNFQNMSLGFEAYSGGFEGSEDVGAVIIPVPSAGLTFLGFLAMAEIQAPLEPIDGNWCLAMEEIQAPLEPIDGNWCLAMEEITA